MSLITDLRLEEFPRCIICGICGEQIYEQIEDRRFNVAGKFNFSLCPACGLLWLDPRPVISDLHKCYRSPSQSDDIKSHNEKHPHTIITLLKDYFRKNVFCGAYGYRHLHPRHILCRLGKALTKIPFFSSKAIYGLGPLFPHFQNGPDSLIVDIGCGSKAEYLKIMKNLGWKVLGIDTDRNAVKKVKDNGIPIFSGTLEQARLPDAVADQITMMHVIEHLPDPLNTIDESFRILKKGGRLVVRTPNADSLGHKVFQRNYFHLDPPRHLFIFSPQSISMLFQKSPFKNFYFKTTPSPAKCIYDNSVKRRKSRVGRIWFALKESFFCFLGNNCGEEIELVAVK